MNRIAEQFQSYQKEIVPREASESQKRETKRAFYAGAQAMMTLLQVTTNHRVSVNEGAKILFDAEVELQRFYENVTAGRA